MAAASRCSRSCSPTTATYDCVNRVSSDIRRARFTPEEVANLTLDFYRSNYIEGLFLSSGIIQSPDYTMEHLIRVARLLREEYHFNGYIHLKAIPGASQQLLEDLWKTYYGSIFNPARLNTRAMRSDMPSRYWKNMPELDTLPELLKKAPGLVQTQDRATLRTESSPQSALRKDTR
jgi:hypothetical protein